MHLQQKRRRGVLLTAQGLCKLQNAKQQAEHNDNQRLTLELLSLRTGLDSHTLCKIFNRTNQVDKKSLAKCFQAFNLILQPGDYGSSTAPSSDLNSSTVAVSPVGSILNDIKTLSLDDQRNLLDTMQFRLGSDDLH